MKFDNDFREMKIRHIVIMFLIIIFFAIVVTVIISLKKGSLSDTDTITVSLFIEILLVLMMAFKLRLCRKNVKHLYVDFKENLNIKEIFWIILCITCLQIGSSNILIYLAYMISPNFANWFANESGIVINSMKDYWITFIASVFLAPFTEEIIFRNTLFKRISKKFNVYIGLIVSSIIFSSVNFGPQMVGVFLFGILNCMLYVKYENILVPMIIYFFDGTINMILVILFNEFGNQTIVLTSMDMILYAGSGVGLFIVGMIFFIKFVKENKIYLSEMYNKKKTLEFN